jgi:hypothetical protein
MHMPGLMRYHERQGLAQGADVALAATMPNNSPARAIVQFLERLPDSVQSNVCAMPVLLIDREHKP